MNKISLFLSLLLAFAGATKAQDSEDSQVQKVVLVEDAAEELTDGTVIALQCRDYSAGSGYYFAGASRKTPTFSANNLFVVEGNAKDGMKLRRFNGTKYIGKSGSTVSEVDNAGIAATFTAKSYKKGNFTLDNPGAEMDGTEESRALYVRFTTAGTHLNTRGLTDNPNYAGGEGGWSVWYVYRYPEYKLNIEQVSQASLSFERPDADPGNVQVTVSISDGGSTSDVAAQFALTTNDNTNNLKTNLNPEDEFTTDILCPDANIGNNQTAALTFTLTGLPEGFSFNRVLLDIHSLFSNGAYQTGARNCSVRLSYGEEESKTQWGTIENQNITNKGGIIWTLTGQSVEAENGKLVLTLNISRGTNNGFFYFGLRGITLINEKNRPENEEVSEETVKEMKIADVEDLLKVIEDGYNSLGYEFPVLAKGVTAEDVVWPQALNGETVFTGLNSNFELLTHAKNAIENEENRENLDAAKQNLADFIRICKLDNNYPISVVYTAAADYGTLYTPFAVETLPDGLTLQKCTGCADNVLILSEEENNSSAAVANTAYIVKANDSAVETTVQLIGFYSQSNTQANSSSPLKGTHTGTTLTAGGENNYYVLQNLDVLGFYEVGGESINVPAHKCYLQLPAGLGVKCLLFPDGTLTAIDSVDAAKPADAATYDLSGRRVSTMTKGLYIVGGKKVLVK